MGTIRNRVIIVHHFKKDEIEKVRQDAVDFFQEFISKQPFIRNADVDKEVITPIMESLINHEYTFMIMGECSKIGWTESEFFQKKRKEWIERNKEKCQNIILLDFGEEYEAEIEEYKL